MPRGQASQIGTRRTSPNGYLYEKTEHGWVLVHRLIAEKKLGRELMPNEYATFADGDRTNLNPDNIIVRARGRTSLRRRLAQIEAHIKELEAARDELKRRIALQESLATGLEETRV
jgi:hypothetical protein